MLRNAKATILTVATVLAAGCASSNFKAGHQYGKQWKSVDDRRVAKAQTAKSPKILPATYFAAAQLFETQGSFGRAITQYQRTIRAQHDHADARHRLGRLLGRIGQHVEAVAMLRSAVEVAPQRASLHNDLGFELAHVKAWDESEYAFRKAIELRPGFPRAYINLAMTLCRLDRHDEGLESFLAVLPEADAYYNLGLMYRGQRRYTKAVETFRTALSMNPDLTAAHRQVALLLAKIKRTPPVEEEVLTDKGNQRDAGVVVLGPTFDDTRVGNGQTTQSVAVKAVTVKTVPAVDSAEPREDDRRFVAIDPASRRTRPVDSRPDFVDDPFGKEYLAADMSAMRALVGPPERGDTVADTRPLDEDSLVCVLDSVVEICEGDVFCHADIEEPTMVAESLFVESYSVPVSFVGQPEDLQMIQSSVTPMHEYELLLAEVREEIDCLTELEEEGEAMAIAQLYGLDFSPPVQPTRSASAVQPKRSAIVAKTTHDVEVPVVKQDRLRKSDRSRSTMAARVTPAHGGKRMPQKRFVPFDNAKGRGSTPTNRRVRLDGFSFEPVSQVPKGTKLERLAERLARVREEISCLEDAAIEENFSRVISRVGEPGDVDPGFGPTGRNSTKSNNAKDAKDGKAKDVAATARLASTTDTVHPVVAWLDRAGRDLLAEWPQTPSVAMPVAPKVKTAPVKTMPVKTAPVVPVMKDTKRPTGRRHASARTTLPVRLTEKVLDGGEQVGNQQDRNQVGPPVEARPANAVVTREDVAVVSPWMVANREILENEVRCRTNQAATGVLPPALSFDAFLEIVGSKHTDLAVRP